jgi:hypothetical protein
MLICFTHSFFTAWNRKKVAASQRCILPFGKLEELLSTTVTNRRMLLCVLSLNADEENSGIE